MTDTLRGGRSGQTSRPITPWQPENPDEHNRYFRKVLDELAAAVYVTDAHGRIIYFNEAAATMWGHRPKLGESEWCGSWKLFWPDGKPLPHDECPMAIALKEGRAIRGLEAVAERPDGVRVPFVPYPTPLFNEAGELMGAVNLLMDITHRKGIEEYAQQLAAIVSSSDDAIVSKDLNGVIRSWNAGAERLFGYTAEEAVGRPVSMLIPEDRINEEPAILERLRHGERVDHYETIRRHKDGSLLDISLTISPVKDLSGKVIGASKIARDIGDRKRAQEQQAFLLNEMKHRIRNTLATVQAIATQTMQSASKSDRTDFMSRLNALASAHDLLTLERWNRAPLHDVITAALAPFQEKHNSRFVINGTPGVVLEANKALLLTMALHELGTNAIKYGALSNAAGRVNISWEVQGLGSPRLKLHWRETGGPEVATPSTEKQGFGSQLINRAFASVGDAKLNFNRLGVSCDLEIAL